MYHIYMYIHSKGKVNIGYLQKLSWLSIRLLIGGSWVQVPPGEISPRLSFPLRDNLENKTLSLSIWVDRETSQTFYREVTLNIVRYWTG